MQEILILQCFDVAGLWTERNFINQTDNVIVFSKRVANIPSAVSMLISLFEIPKALTRTLSGLHSR